MSARLATEPMRLLSLIISFIGIASSLGLPYTTSISGTDNDTTTAMCSQLASQLPGRISYPASSIYTTSLQTYYSAQERALIPSCIFTPTSTADVSLFITSMTAGNDASIPDFAIRSGGHKYFAGAANIAGGITVDMRGMHNVSFNSDANVVSIGAGAIWSSDVYEYLVARNLTAAGARLPGIGIGGFVLGGGITFLARRNGWSCDTVLGYEIVLASGLTIYATATSPHHDLFLALKGGSNNFGIVTRFDMSTYPQGSMLGGIIGFNYTPAVLDAQANAFANFMRPENFDEKAMMGVLLTYENGVAGVANSIFYLEPDRRPGVYEEFLDMGGQVENKLLVADVGDIVKQFGAFTPPALARAAETTYTIQTGTSLLIYTLLFTSYNTSLTTLTSASIPGSGIQWLLQPLPLSPSPSSNSFALPPAPLAKNNGAVIISLVVGWNNEADDAYMLAFLKGMHDDMVEILKREGVWEEFVYLNYANVGQDVFGSYGEGGQERLREVSRMYDPRGVFQTKVPGGFKLF